MGIFKYLLTTTLFFVLPNIFCSNISKEIFSNILMKMRLIKLILILYQFYYIYFVMKSAPDFIKSGDNICDPLLLNFSLNYETMQGKKEKLIKPSVRVRRRIDYKNISLDQVKKEFSILSKNFITLAVLHGYGQILNLNLK